MITLPKYNPCEEYINEIKLSFFDKTKSAKKIAVKYDKCKFITNLIKGDMFNVIIDNANVFYNDRGILVISVLDDFFADGISQCPQIKNKLLNDIYLDGILKRMFSQIEFGFYVSGKISNNEVEICDNIFKSIYSKSIPIKMDNINQSIDKYNVMQKDGYINKKVIDGIIYAVYDYYNSLRK